MARSVLGPFRLIWPVHSPLNAAGAYGLAVTALLLTAPGSRRRCVRKTSLVWNSAVAAGVVLFLVTAAYVRSLGVGFLADDFTLLRHSLTATAESLAATFTAPGGDGFYRPLGAVAFASQARWAGADPLRWHVVGLALHGLNSVLVYLLAARLLSSGFTALVAASLFAIHNNHTEAVVWVAARFDLLATLFVLIGLLLHLESSGSSGLRAVLCRAGAVAAMTAAILTKESAYVLPLLLVCLPDGRSLRVRLKAASPLFAVAGLLFAYRWMMFGDVGGYLVEGSPQALQVGFASTLKALGMRLWALLYFPINWSTDPGWLGGFGLLLLVVSTLALAATRKSLRRLPWLIFVLLAVLPVLPFLLVGADLWGSRVLYLPSIGYCLLLASAADGLFGWRRVTATAGLVLAHFILVQQNLANWEYASARVRAACLLGARHAEAAVVPAAAGLPRTIRGVPAFLDFKDCITAIRRDLAGAASVSHVRSQPAVLAWDPGRDELRCLEGCLEATPAP
ncbi:MAG TPA: hypothetical protein VNJ11_08915 [Bryobacteraceae bacterium]|nr:hypothetical protein [Bryobacteraceae bacterium]